MVAQQAKQRQLAGDDADYDRRIASGKSAARNRVAQQKYRERQKQKKKEYQEQVDLLAKRLAQVEMENHSLGERNRLLETMAHMAEQDEPAPQEARSQPAQVCAADRKGIVLADFFNALQQHRPPLVSPQEALDMPQAELKRRHLEFVQTIASLLLRAESDKGAYMELEGYILQKRRAKDKLMNTLSMREAAEMLASKNWTGKKLAKMQSNPFKESMVTVMQLTPDQIRDLRQLKEAALTEVRAIRAERNSLTREFSQSVEMPHMELCCLEMCSELTEEQVTRMMRGLTLDDRFKDSLNAEHMCWGRFYSSCSKVITPLQEAHAMVEGFPDSHLDMWVLPGYLEAKQRGQVQAWLAQGGAMAPFQVQSPAKDAAIGSGAGRSTRSGVQGAGSAESDPQHLEGLFDLLQSSEGSAPSAGIDGSELQLTRFPSIPPDFRADLNGSEDLLLDFLPMSANHINSIS